MGALVLCAKADEADDWKAYAKQVGREHDVIEIDHTAQKRFNFLDYALATIAQEEGMEQNLLAVMDTVIEAASGKVAESGGDNQYFYDNAREMVSHVLPILIAVYGRLTINDIVNFINSAPKSQQQLASREWQRESYCAKTLALASLVMEEKPDIAIHGDYWVTTFADLSDKGRSSIVTTFTSTVYPFRTGKLRDLFCTDTNIVPEMTQNGAILIVNLPIKKFGKMGEAAQKIVKYLWQLSIEARPKQTRGWWIWEKDIRRPVALFADECQFFVSSYDDKFFSTARSARACGVYLTQDLPSFYARLAGAAGEHGAEALIGKFQTTIVHAGKDRTTNQAAADLVGKITMEQASTQQSDGRNSGGGGAQHTDDTTLSDNSGRNVGRSRTVSTYRDYAISPEYFTNQLRNGMKENRFKVDGIMVTIGRTWKHSKANFIKTEFNQKL
jgi:hypothetical protein